MQIGLIRMISTQKALKTYKKNRVQNSTFWALIKRLEWCESLFLDSALALFFGGDGSGNRELPEDNSSSIGGSLSPGRMGFLPLFCLTGGAGGTLPRAFSPRSSSKRARR